MRTRNLIWIALVAAMGCAPDFDEPWEVVDLRVLALDAEPPERLFRELPVELLDDPEALADQLGMRVGVLAADPRDPEREVTWEAWACTPDESFCDGDSLLRLPLLVEDDGRCAPAPADTPPETYRQTTRLDGIGCEFVPSAELLEASLEADPFRGFGGLPVVVELRLQDGEQYVSGFKRLAYTFPLPYSPVPELKEPNRNPQLAAVLVEDEPLDIDEGLTVSPGGEVVLLPVPADDAQERYWVVAAENPFEIEPGAPNVGEEELEEALSYSFFATTGQLSHATTGGRDNPFVDDKKVTDISATWTAPAIAANGEVWIVIRDDRGGVSWVSFPVAVR